ncbi:DUF1310 family protein [Enterococcus sp. LJL128]
MVNQTKNEKENTTDLEIKRIRKSVFYKIVGLILVIIVGIGVKVYMDEKKFNDEMMRIVNSDGAKKVYEQTIKNRDSLAFTKGGIIQNYKIDYDSVEHNPMGGIMLDLTVNEDPALTVGIILNKKSDGTLHSGVVVISSKLSNILEDENANGN